LLTLPLTFPARLMINSAISSRGWLNVPVITQVVPVMAESLVFRGSTVGFRPAFFNRAIKSRLCGS
jgi:hypothetical protein